VLRKFILTALLLGGLSTNSLAEIRLSDDLGRELVFAAPLQRIVSLAPHNTENLFSAGAGGQIVGTVDHSDFPPAALAIPRVGNYKQINIEAVLALQPDLIIAWSSGNPGAAVQRLIDLGLPVFFSEPGDFEQIISNIERFAELSGHASEQAAKIKGMREELTHLQQQYASRAPVRVFYQVWDQPMITLNGEHAVSRAISICGGVNVFSDEPTIAPRINIEGIISKNPQLILLASHEAGQTETWLREWQKWPAIAAVSDQQIKAIDANVMNRPTERFVRHTRTLCEQIDAARLN